MAEEICGKEKADLVAQLDNIIACLEQDYPVAGEPPSGTLRGNVCWRGNGIRNESEENPQTALTVCKRYRSEPNKSWPVCPETKTPPTRNVAHPFFKNVYFKECPIEKERNLRVTVDGRLAESTTRTKYYEYTDPPLGIPPWYRPRSKSVEIRGGKNMYGCECWKKNGLQDDCRRWYCARPECLTKPLPECPPSSCPPILGVRKPNAFMM